MGISGKNLVVVVLSNPFRSEEMLTDRLGQDAEAGFNARHSSRHRNQSGDFRRYLRAAAACARLSQRKLHLCDP